MNELIQVKPLPYPFCKGCSHNGCYPWNSNPLTLCTENEGMLPTVLMRDGDEITGCMQFHHADRIWDAYIHDVKEQALKKEEMRLRALKGIVIYTNEEG